MAKLFATTEGGRLGKRAIPAANSRGNAAGMGTFTMTEKEELQRKLEQLERFSKHKDSIWEARLRYARRGLEVTNRELALANSKLAKANRELTALRKSLEEKVQSRTRELRTERDRIQRIIAQLSDGLLLIDEDGKVSLMNAQAEAFLKISSSELLHRTLQEVLQSSPRGDFFRFVLKLSPNHRERYKVFASEQSVLEVTKTHVTKAEKIVGSIILLHDVTRETMIEKMKSEFVSLAAHQLRTPLSATKWVISLLLEGDTGSLTSEQKELLEKGRLSSERMIALVNDMLDVVRIEEGRFNYHFQQTSLVVLLKQTMQDTKLMAEQKGLHMVLRVSKVIPKKMRLDPEKFRLALANIIDNAIRYTPSGGRIYVVATKEKEGVCVKIQDTGIGIPKSQSRRLFEKFFRGTNAQKVNTTGSGLGLFIAKNIVEKHGGNIWIESKEGKGTTVYLTIPFNRNKEAPVR